MCIGKVYDFMLRTLFGFLVLWTFFSCGGGGTLSRDDGTNGGTTGSGTVTPEVLRWFLVMLMVSHQHHSVNPLL
jgi:hypothetical protein